MATERLRASLGVIDFLVAHCKFTFSKPLTDGFDERRIRSAEKTLL